MKNIIRKINPKSKRKKKRSIIKPINWAQARALALNKPPGIKHLEVTTKIGCSNRCNYCPQETLVREYKKRNNEIYMPIDTFKKCLNKVDNAVKVGFTGMCEPFLNDNCMEMIEIAAQKGHPVYISTTLKGLKTEWINRLEQIKFAPFLVHLPGDTENNIVKEEDYSEKLSAIIKSNISHKKYHFHGTCLHPAAKIAADLAHETKLNSRASNLKSIKTAKNKGPVVCKRSFAHPVLLPNGDLILCCMDYSLDAIIGNLISESVEEIYKCDKFIDLMNATMNDEGSICHQCDAYGNKVKNINIQLKIEK